MYMHIISRLHNITVVQIAIATLLTGIISLALYGFMEARFTDAASANDTFTVTGTVTGEISFAAFAADINLTGLPGVTGGTSTGQTYVRVSTNNASGYNMSLSTESDPGMQGNDTAGTIPDYVPTAPTVPDFHWSVPVNTAYFGYTVEASTTTDLDPSFLDNGTDTCNTGANDTVDRCWLNASTTDEVIVNRSSQTTTWGATTTLKFRMTIMPNPSPVIPTDTYVATNTLTAATNP